MRADRGLATARRARGVSAYRIAGQWQGRMTATVATVAFLGLEARPTEVQVELSAGLPRFTIVGLPDKAVAESRERVHAALASIGLALPPKRITVNLSPADLPKEGSHFDLPIALCLLAAIGSADAETLSHYVVVGELKLDGRIAPSPGVLLAALQASSESKGLICPASQGAEAAWAGDVEVVAAPDLLALLAHLKGTSVLVPPQPGEADPPRGGPDLKQVKGQEVAKRALEIAAAGGHNLLMSGPPGAGKSLLAACLPGILPPLQPAEALEVSMVASVAGELEGGRMTRQRAFRSPHHRASMPALVGGGLRVRPGEISLAHLGVLFLDELPEFQRGVLDSLRQPLKTGNVSVARANTHVTFPARVQLVAAMNPCRCGHLGDPALACSRAPRCAADYQARVSALARPHRPSRRSAGRFGRGSHAAATGRGQRRGGPQGCDRPPTAGRSLQWLGCSNERGGGRRSSGESCNARRSRAQAARRCCGGNAAVRARLSSVATGGAYDCGSRRYRTGREDSCRGGAQLSAPGPAELGATDQGLGFWLSSVIPKRGQCSRPKCSRPGEPDPNAARAHSLRDFVFCRSSGKNFRVVIHNEFTATPLTRILRTWFPNINDAALQHIAKLTGIMDKTHCARCRFARRT